MNYHDIFNWKEYLILYPDLEKNNINTEEQSYEHWINHGIEENRKGFLLKNKYKLFDWEYYINYYQDLKKNNIDNEEKAYKHWINHGIKEKRFMNSSKQIFDIKDISDLNFYVKKELTDHITRENISKYKNNINTKPKLNNNINIIKQNVNNKRKKIAILFSGQMRTNSLGTNTTNNNLIVDSISKHIINDELKNKYDYDVFISTDNTQIHKCKDFFGKNLKNIHCFDINFFMNNIKNQIPSYNKLFHLYMNRNYNNYSIYPNTVWQFYRLYDCYNMMCNYQSVNNYDYIIRARLDTVFQKNIVPKIEELDSNINIHYFGAADMFGIGRIGIMQYYCTMINEKYGTFGEGHKIPDELKWKYAPEYQLHFCLIEYCKLNNINTSMALHSIANSVNDFCPIYR
jgi:hypothetical protein